MLGLKLIHVVSLLLQVKPLQAQIITKGTYFKEVRSMNQGKSQGQTQGDETSPMLDEQMFWCGLDSSCGEIGKLQGQNKYEVVKEGSSKENYDTRLKKIKSGFRDCKESQKEGMMTNGIIEISWRNESSFRGYCNMATDGGGWTVFQRRASNEVDFNRNWTDYVNGFGSLEGSFWLGLEAIHQLTVGKRMTLRIELKNQFGATGYGKYDNFKVLSASEGYKLQYGSYIDGTIGDSLWQNKNMKFSTPDKDNDNADGDNSFGVANCAVTYRGAWWHNKCFLGNLNNLFHNDQNIPTTAEAPNAAVMSWFTWGNTFGGVWYSEMMLKAED